MNADDLHLLLKQCPLCVCACIRVCVSYNLCVCVLKENSSRLIGFLPANAR